MILCLLVIVIQAQEDQKFGFLRNFETLHFNIAAGNQEEFFQDILKANTIVNGTWVASVDQKSIDFVVYDPFRNPIIDIKAENSAKFSFRASRSGVYSFLFSNNHNDLENKIDFALYSGSSKLQMLRSEDIQSLKKRVDELERIAHILTYEFATYQDNQSSTFKILEDTNTKMFSIVFFESLCIVAVTVIQVFHIKKIFKSWHNQSYFYY